MRKTVHGARPSDADARGPVLMLVVRL